MWSPELCTIQPESLTSLILPPDLCTSCSVYTTPFPHLRVTFLVPLLDLSLLREVYHVRSFLQLFFILAPYLSPSQDPCICKFVYLYINHLLN